MAEISSNSAKAHPVHGDIANATHSSIYERLSHKSRWNRFGHYVFSQGVRVLDPWNRVQYRMAMEELLASNINSNLTHEANKFKPPFAWKLREEHPDYVPVSVEKDARSDITDIETKKYHVLGDIPLGDFVSYIRFTIGKHGYAWKKPMSILRTLNHPLIPRWLQSMKNKDEDGFLHITYSGKERGGWTN